MIPQRRAHPPLSLFGEKMVFHVIFFDRPSYFRPRRKVVRREVNKIIHQVPGHKSSKKWHASVRTEKKFKNEEK